MMESTMRNGAGHWDVEFYDFVSGSPGEVMGLPGFGDLHERAVGNGARHGTPVIVSGGLADPRINLFFRTGPMAEAVASTWRRYAFALVVWLNFLHALGRTWDRATVRDVEAFKHWRLTDPSNDERIAPTSFDTDRAALKTFYTWAAARFSVPNPVPAVMGAGRRPGYRDDDHLGPGRGGRDPLRPAGARRRQVKWMLRPAFEQWRDVGLRGYGFDGLRRAGWRGANEDRDAAFVDGLYGTGLRLAEWASVLDAELPADASAGGARFLKAWLSAACIKGRREGREYRIPRSVLRSVASYTDPVEGSRAEAVRRAQLAGRYDGLPGTRIVTGHHWRRRTLAIETEDGVRHVSTDAIGPDERRRLFRRVAGGLEPLSLWLGIDGMPKKAHGWEDTFGDANARVADAWVSANYPALEGQAREDRKAQCPLWCRPHMARHSFALKWFSVLSVIWDSRVDGFTADELADLRDQLGDIWYQMAGLLGHSHPQTAREIYLEPFTALQVDYLMSLLDEDECVAVNALVRSVAADSSRVLGPVPAGSGQ
jgi:hypothetical protein